MKYNSFQLNQIVEAPIGYRKQCHEYVDEGCKSAKELYDYQGQCIDCPLPLCLEEGGINTHCRKITLEAQGIMIEMRKQMSVKEIAKHYGVKITTIYFHLRRGRKVILAGGNEG